jgi:hypothetical protein
MSNLPDRRDGPRWPIRETSGDIIMAALIMGIIYLAPSPIDSDETA